MRKKIITSLVLVTLASSVLTGCSTNADAKSAGAQATVLNKDAGSSPSVDNGTETITPVAPKGNEVTTQNNKNTVITEQKAKEIAFNHAAVKESDVKNLKVTLDTDDGISYYEVEFHVDSTEYDYEIHAQNGSILSHDTDRVEDKEDLNSSNGSVSTKLISEAEAKKIALSHAGVKESEVKNYTIHLDQDDATYEYEIEFYVGSKEYDYSIHAQTGAILDTDTDYDNSDEDKDAFEDEKEDDNEEDDTITSTPSTPSNLISESKAKQIVLAKVPGATESHMKLHLEKENGSYVYEGTLLFQNTEYDFELDALTGNILEWDVETDEN